jgi:hypothetical protein
MGTITLYQDAFTICAHSNSITGIQPSLILSIMRDEKEMSVPDTDGAEYEPNKTLLRASLFDFLGELQLLVHKLADNSYLRVKGHTR